MELYQIRYYLALCDTLNFARAAERCNVSQPSLSRAVKALEQELGGLLIRREHRRTHLTELGRTLRPMLQQMVLQAERTKSTARQLLNSGRNRLKLAVMASIGPARLGPFLARFGAAHPATELILVQTNGSHARDLLLDGSVDFAILAGDDGSQGPLRQYPLYGERLVTVFPSGHDFERLDAVRIADVKHTRLLLCVDREMQPLVADTCRKQGCEPRFVCLAEMVGWVEALVVAGAGVAIMPECSHLGHATVARPLLAPELERQVSLIAVAGRAHDAIGHALMRAIRTYDWSGSRQRDGIDVAAAAAGGGQLNVVIGPTRRQRIGFEMSQRLVDRELGRSTIARHLAEK
jgi:DNA-binding transcriptional LysR family regulator